MYQPWRFLYITQIVSGTYSSSKKKSNRNRITHADNMKAVRKCIIANYVKDKNRMCRDTMSMAWCTVMFHLTPKTFGWLVIHLTYSQEREKKALWELNDATSHIRSQTDSEPSGAVPYLESPNVLFLCRITLWAAAKLTHAAMMYREHMAFGICPQGFASEGPAFDILGGREPVSHRQAFGLRTWHSVH